MKDAELNEIGRFWITYLSDVKDFNKEVDKFTDCDLYTLYEKRKQINSSLNRLLNLLKDDKLKETFERFKSDLLKSINEVIFSKEIREKYEDGYTR